MIRGVVCHLKLDAGWGGGAGAGGPRNMMDETPLTVLMTSLQTVGG